MIKLIWQFSQLSMEGPHSLSFLQFYFENYYKRRNHLEKIEELHLLSMIVLCFALDAQICHLINS